MIVPRELKIGLDGIDHSFGRVVSLKFPFTLYLTLCLFVQGTPLVDLYMGLDIWVVVSNLKLTKFVLPAHFKVVCKHGPGIIGR